MQFFYKGPKKHYNSIDFFSGCAIFVGFAAFIFFLTLLDDIEDLGDHAFEIIMFVIVAGVTVAGVFQKKAKLHNTRLVIKNDVLRIKKELTIPMEKIRLDLYKKDGTFVRYHLYDTQGKVAIYSIYEDDLSRFIQENYADITSEYTVDKTMGGESVSTLVAGSRTLSYSLSTGKYTISENEEIVLDQLPEFYSYDSKYKAKA
ncbi:hypothetical protein [Gilvibacter sp.]|uniref:hypothetical protein n=1 Tax=Gilvibacter sp. TaxID=2729997 RepID=UPI003F4A16DA